MTTHELARLLLTGPDLPAYTRNQTYDETTFDEVTGFDDVELTRFDFGTHESECFITDKTGPKYMKLKVMVIE